MSGSGLELIKAVYHSSDSIQAVITSSDIVSPHQQLVPA